MAFNGNYTWVAIWVITGAIFDFFDGFSARILKSYSPMGKELDSLADMVTFGLAPAIALFQLLPILYGSSSNTNEFNISIFNSTFYISELFAYFAFLLVIFSGLRLAKFNIDNRQTTSFIGLPTPANALFWISYCLGISLVDPSTQSMLFYPTLVLIVIFSLLLVSEIPMFSLKVQNLKFKGNELRYILFVVMLVAVLVKGMFGICIGIIVYILLSIFSAKRS